MQVSITVQGGTIVSVNGVAVGAQTATGTTDSSGNVTILVSRSTWGMLTVTVMVPGSESLTKTVSACFYDSSAAPVEIFRCFGNLSVFRELVPETNAVGVSGTCSRNERGHLRA